MIGIGYVRHGRDAEVGLDCLGLALEYYKRMGFHHIIDPAIDPDGAEEQWNIVHENFQTGDMLSIISDKTLPDHVGIYIHPGMILHVRRGDISRVESSSIFEIPFGYRLK